MNRSVWVLVGVLVMLGGCVQKQVKPDNPMYAPIRPQDMQPVQPMDGSIYNAATSMNLYGDGRAYRVGDILTVTLQEQTSSKKKNKTELDKETSVSLEQGTAFGNGISVLGNPLSFNLPTSTTEFAGEGKSDMSNSLNGSISVTVHEVLPNGVLLVRGEKWLTLNQGDEYIRVSGMVRPQDIGSDNSIASTKLADARIAYSGTGAVNDTNVMGWLSRFFVSALWPL
ncbi:flagellar basal body L-ring protein FlgH [Neptuniibacter sp. CAU 1671]|uniref:flagellar basal body L-ring protein FlgH n=1 Tax=Neptuniibacter sp. CAU 1671 TaxID=3032593 RepID=UPI0023DC1428|nr:flagellar basal body L-ring protein FlgH [Neptuniibacter sp. CAU 1671]MDF2181823.1 flagellar basal body L-ring protein FlgH [Neptuniibacter sp. CAU 1671]